MTVPRRQIFLYAIFTGGTFHGLLDVLTLCSLPTSSFSSFPLFGAALLTSHLPDTVWTLREDSAAVHNDAPQDCFAALW